MCFHIIPLCPGCEEPSGLGEEVIYSDDVCCGHCPPEDVSGSTTRLMTKNEVSHPDFECSTPGCGDVGTTLSAAQEEAEVQRARDHAKQFLRENHENCISLCILPFVDEPAPDIESPPEPPILGFRPVNKPNRTGLHGKSRPWSKPDIDGQKRGQQWTREEEVALWRLRRQGMQFSQIAKQIDRTERGCYDRYNKLRNGGFGRK